MKQQLADFRQNLNSGFAFALFYRRGPVAFRSGLDQLVWLLLFSLLLDVAVDHINHRPDPSFNHYALSTFGLTFLLLGLSCYLLSLVLRRRDALVPMMTVIYSTALVFSLAEIALVQLWPWAYAISPEVYRLFTYLYLVWFVVIVVRAALLSFDRRRYTVWVVLPILMVFWLLPLRVGDWDSSFWEANYPAQKDSYAAYRKIDAESLLYAQPRMVTAALQSLSSQRPGRADLYFVSFGGYAYQDVFMKEVHYAGQTMDARYDTKGHSLALVNNLKTREELPLATSTNLSVVLKQLGEAMNVEEDVLMLYLTSHGSKRHELAVDFWPLPLNDITPLRLREMLDEAGIKWRVIVISACYSGGFVDALQDDYTLVATAAAADRQSFGCGNEEDFTYFGEALFRDELQHGSTLLDAFASAREAIADREKREKLEPSQPQLYIAPLMEQKLNEMAEPRLIECHGEKTPASAVEC